RLPVLLKGPTGCGKTRFVEHMAYRLGGEATNGIPGNLITVACHEDLTGSDLVGRYLIKGDETIWVDGPLTRAVRSGTICYLDEIVEARKDTIVLIHPLTDHRRLLPSGLEEGVSTRLLVYAGQLMRSGITPARACEVAVSKSLTDDHESQRAIAELARAVFA